MNGARESAAVVALVRLGRRPGPCYAELIERRGSAEVALDAELGDPSGQTSLLPEDPEPLIARAAQDIQEWRRRGFELVTVLDPTYPENLRGVHDRPPLIFRTGRRRASDERSVAIVGSRQASAEGVTRAQEIAEYLVREGFSVVSGLALGIDTAAHLAALGARGRTIAVIGTGLTRCYPPQNAALQRRISAEGVVISQFWPDDLPDRDHFPQRNAVMSGLARGTVVVEASARSGARIQARLALGHGRPVFLTQALVQQKWACELAQRPGVHVIDGPGQIIETIAALEAGGPLVE